MELETKDDNTLINQGAEARIYITDFNGIRCIVKERFVKKYRLAVLDAKITKNRIVSEVKIILKVLKNLKINVPAIYCVDIYNRKIFMQYIYGKTVKQYIFDAVKTFQIQDCNFNENILENLLKNIGKDIATMHNNNIIHGDLTTSNMIWSDNNLLYFIDFGLSFISIKEEDKAVDLYVLERAFLSTHSVSIDNKSNFSDKMFDIILQSYYNNSDKPDSIKKKYEIVRKRGRKRSMVG